MSINLLRLNLWDAVTLDEVWAELMEAAAERILNEVTGH
jgi:hypothetical protein